MDADQHFSPRRPDLRSAALEYKRHNDRAAKWGLGGWTSRSCECPNRRWNGQARSDEWNPNAPEWHARPVHAHSQSSYWDRRNRQHALLKEKKHLATINVMVDENDDGAGLKDGSTPVNISPDADIFYSFDAPAGPTQGMNVLDQALTQAVERFEVKQTDKLIREEYEVVQPEAEEVAKSQKVPPDVDDGFELV